MAYTDTKHIELMSNKIECFLVYGYVPVKVIFQYLGFLLPCLCRIPGLYRRTPKHAMRLLLFCAVTLFTG